MASVKAVARSGQRYSDGLEGIVESKFDKIW